MQFLLLLTLTAASGQLQAPDAVAPSADDAALERGKLRYGQGKAQFAAADYRSAIETWTQLLSELPGDEQFDEIRIDLLYNIAVAHVREYEFDKEKRHLLQARTLFSRYADAKPGNTDVAEKLAEVESKLAAADGQDTTAEPAPPPATVVPGQPDNDDAGPRSGDKPWLRPMGIGLAAGGGAVMLGGVGLLVAGSRFRPSAEDNISILDEMDVPQDDPARDEAARFLDEETKRGNTFMITGGALLGAGAVVTGVGIWALLRARKENSGATATLRLVPHRRGATLMGRF